MSLPPMPRILLAICLPIITGIGLSLLMYLHLQGVLLRWQPELHPAWGWIICTIGVLVILVPIIDLSCDLRIIDVYYQDGLVLAFWCVAGVLISIIGWSLESVLVLGSYLLIGLLYLVSFAPFLFGLWQLGIMALENPDGASGDKQRRTTNRGRKYNEGYAQGHAEGYTEGYAGGRTTGYSEGRAKERTEGHNRRYNEGYAAGHAKGYAQGHADNAVQRDEGTVSFDPWRVLGLSPGATPQAIQNAFREQAKLYHPDRVAHLGIELQEIAERKTKDLNRAHEILKGR